MLTARAFLSSSSVHGKIYAIGGVTWNWKPLGNVEEYDLGIVVEKEKSIGASGKITSMWGAIKGKR